MSSVDFINENINWRDITPGGEVYEGGTAADFRTGDWRVAVPEKCYKSEKTQQTVYWKLQSRD